MFAVVKTGGKQYRVSPGDVVLVVKIEGEAGQAINLEEVLMYGEEGNVTLGAPCVAQAQVCATIREQTRGEKILVFKKRRRQGYRRTAGHRQDLTVLKIDALMVGGKTLAGDASSVKPAKAPKAEAPAKAEKGAAPMADEKPVKKAAAPKAEKSAEAPAKKAAAPKAKKTETKE